MSANASPVLRFRVAVPSAALVLVACAAPASAQRLSRIEPVSDSKTLLADAPQVPSAGGVFLASALVPGAGQYRLRAGRWVAYIGVEAWAWLTWADARAEANDLEGEYRDLAWAVARRISVGNREEREFEYYEAMSSFAESGSFDADPGTPGIQPEEEESSFNGSVWALAQAIFYPATADSVPPTPAEEAAALDYYRRNAIVPAFAWSWGSNLLEQEHFRTLIRRSDEAARASTTILGVILVNHVVSAVDAMITARLRSRGIEPPLRLRGQTLRGPGGPTSYLVVEIPIP